MSELFPIPSLGGTISKGGQNLSGSLSSSEGLNGKMSNDILHRSYNELRDKPSINEVNLVGNKTFEELGLTAITPQDIDNIIFGGDE